MKGTVSIDPDFGVFRTDALDELDAFFRAHGFAILRGLYSRDDLATMLAECAEAQARVANGELANKHGNSILTDAAAGRRFANYVQYITQIAPTTRAAVLHPAIVGLMARWIPGGHLREHSRFGVVYQDARSDVASGYNRIGWHSDWQSGPQLDVWPSAAFTIHVDGTSPANGFLRVVPGSHLWATPAPYHNANNVAVPEGARAAGGHTSIEPPFAMPLAFEKAPGEVAVYCDDGDVLFHDAYLWHSAASATDSSAVRRHIRGAWFSGKPDAVEGDYLEDFVKNAAR
ncbi:MAG: phytanoyl-CoA dioxygenase family protein [Hyphomonadaceae bacterium]|nr:phytanoyl-CoA dioxygenase family protein [Hyphomonadaceae bacterium]